MPVLRQVHIVTELSDQLAFQSCGLRPMALLEGSFFSLAKKSPLECPLCVTFLSSSYDNPPPPKSGKSQGVPPFPTASSQWHLINISRVFPWKYFVQFKAILFFQKSPNPVLNTKHEI